MSSVLNELTVSPFNGAVELGFRSLVLLNECYPNEFSLRQLVVLDYLMVHSDDVSGGPEGLHPQTPYRSGELLVRREPLQDGLLLFQSRGLISKHFRPDGVLYSASETSDSFLEVIESQYYLRLKERAQWVKENFAQTNPENLEQLVGSNLGRWGAEFEMASVLWREPGNE